LVRLETTIVYAVGVLGASLASLVSHAVVSSTVLLATVVIGRGACTRALVRRNAGTSVTYKISSHGRRSVVGNAISIGGARVAATILVTVVVGTANSVAGASSVTDLVNADSLTTKVTTTDSRSSAISIGETIEANSVGLTVSTLSTSTSEIVYDSTRASVNAKSGGLIAVRLILDFTSILAGASGRGSVNDTVLARARDLTVVTALSLAAGVVRTRERAHADASSIARSLSSRTGSTRKTSLRAIDVSAIRRVGNDSGRARGLAVSTDTVGTAVSSVVSGDTSLSGLLDRAPSIGETSIFADVGLGVADGLVVSVGAISIVNIARRSGASTIEGSAEGVTATGAAVHAKTGLLTVGARSQEAVRVNRTLSTDASFANLLALLQTTVTTTWTLRSTVSIRIASLASSVQLTVRSTSDKRARSKSSYFAKIGVAGELVNADTSCCVASSLANFFTTIKNTTVRILGASFARSVRHTIFTTSARTTSVRKTGSIITNSTGLGGAISIGSALTATLGGVRIANRSSRDDLGAESVQCELLSSVRLSSRDVKDTRRAGTFPFSNKTGNIDIRLGWIGRIGNTRCISGGTRTSITNFHLKDVVVENSVEASGTPGSG